MDRGLIKLEARLRHELDDVLDREETLWYQKSRIDWLKNGERNTTFFHLSTVIRRWKNKTVAIKNNEGEWIYETELVKEHMVNYFSELFAADDEPTSFNIPHDIFPELSSRDWNSLARPFSKLEIDEVIKTMGALKAPGPDGFQALFYQKNWEIVAKNVYEMVLPALEGKGLPDHINDTHLVLLPKVENPELASQFRPIGLCNVAYKIIAKVLVNRVKPILPLLISNTQASFVPGRQITDNIVIVQEVIHTMRRKQGAKGYMALKIDFEKAYDRLRWSFIRDTLNQMNLPILLVNVIMECVTSTSMQVLWNGEPTRSFKPTRGIRQGDPLSPYLFVMCMERLYQTIEEEIMAQRWKPIRASRNGPLLSNLFFADDIILFAEANSDQARIVNDCLGRFCCASGQRVSCTKSRIYFSTNVTQDMQHDISQILNMEATEDLGLYLGMPTLTHRITKDTFSHLCEKLDRRLAGWKTKYLSLAGRITLTKSTLSTLATYSMQTARLPRSTCEDLDKKVRKFIWGGNEDKRGTHLLAWETLQKPLQQGGLGIRSAKQANAAFLTKLGWRMLTEPNSLWSRVLRSKYCKGRCDIDMFVQKANSSNVWRGITDNARILCEGLKMAVGNGARTLFWDHCWVLDKPLSEMIIAPVPQDLAGATVEELWEHGVGWK